MQSSQRLSTSNRHRAIDLSATIMKSLTVCMIAILGVGALGSCAPESQASLPARRSPSVVDKTTSLGILSDAGEIQLQTIAVVGPGSHAPAGAVPPCLESGDPGAAKVEGLAHELKNPDWLPCDGEKCLGHKVAAPAARALFEPSGPREKTLANSSLLFFRNSIPFGYSSYARAML